MRNSKGQFISRAQLIASRSGIRRCFDTMLVLALITGAAVILSIMDVYDVPHICVG